MNPMRYRGYYYDNETGLYYLQSRYYDAEVGRFVSVDEPELIFEGEINLFKYCENNPVMYMDLDGLKAVLYYYYGKDQESHAKRNINKLEEKYKVVYLRIESSTIFKAAWNRKGLPDKLDVVIINLHGSPSSVEYMNLNDLNNKKIDTLILLSCNAGHQYLSGSSSFAKKLFDKFYGNVRQLIACDGTHYRGGFLKPSAISVEGDKHWKRYVHSTFINNKKYPKSKGFVRYTKSTNRVGYTVTSIGFSFSSVADLLKAIGKW